LGKSSRPDLKRLLPSVAIATFYVAIAPIMIVWSLGAAGILRSPVLSVAGVLVLSFGLSSVGAASWKKWPGSEDVLFGDLLVWNWVRRWRVERRLDEAAGLLGLAGGAEPTPRGRVPSARQAELIENLASALEARDPYTHGHSRRVARYSVLIAQRMGLPEELVDKVRAAAAVHDVGKINVPRAVLNKPGKLTSEEFALIQRHAENSAWMVDGVVDDEITAIVRHHHERMDGSGYPAGLSGEKIPLGSRIIAVADTFDALTSRRPYRDAMSHKAALHILTVEAGTQLDPIAVRGFRSYYSGRRALTLWNGLTIVPLRLVSWLGKQLGLGGSATTGQAIGTAAATALIGGAVALSALPPTSAQERASREIALVEARLQSEVRGGYGNLPRLEARGPTSSGIPSIPPLARRAPTGPGDLTAGPAADQPSGLDQASSSPSGATDRSSGSTSGSTGAGSSPSGSDPTSSGGPSGSGQSSDDPDPVTDVSGAAPVLDVPSVPAVPSLPAVPDVPDVDVGGSLPDLSGGGVLP